MDGHGSHTYNYEFMMLMKENDVEVMCLPPHSTHWLQPADKSLFKSLKSHWEEAGRKWVAETGGCRVAKKEFFSLFTPVWQSCTTAEVCQNGFRATGRFPVNAHCIAEVAYAPRLTTERSLPASSPSATYANHSSTLTSVSDQTSPVPADGPSATGPSTSQSASQAVGGQSSFKPVSFYDLVKIPTRQRSASTKRRKPPSSTLTSDEHFEFLLNKKPKKGEEKQKSS